MRPLQANPVMSAPEPASLCLKAATRQAHANLEQTAVMRHLMSTALTRQSYAVVLGIWQQVWMALESALQAHLPQGISALNRPMSRGECFAKDLAALQTGQPLDTSGTRPAASCTFDGAAARWYGLAYVARGSELGGAVIASQLQRQLGLSAEHGASFFAAHSTLPMPLAARWRLWLSWLDGQLKTPADIALAMQAATSAFASITAVFENGEPSLLELMP